MFAFNVLYGIGTLSAIAGVANIVVASANFNDFFISITPCSLMKSAAPIIGKTGVRIHARPFLATDTFL